MTIPDTITQAVERLRRLKAGESYVSVYGDEMREWNPKIHNLDITDTAIDTLEPRDRETLADFLLSIWPKGDRPAAMERSHQFNDANCELVGDLWYVGDEGYPTEAAARLELHWRKVLELVAMAGG